MSGTEQMHTIYLLNEGIEVDLRQSLGLNPRLSGFKIHGLGMPYPVGCLTECRYWG